MKIIKNEYYKLSVSSALTIVRDIFYNIRRAANSFNKTLEDIFDINYAKIKQRYPDGFGTYKSVNRDEFVLLDSNGESKGRVHYE